MNYLLEQTNRWSQISILVISVNEPKLTLTIKLATRQGILTSLQNWYCRTDAKQLVYFALGHLGDLLAVFQVPKSQPCLPMRIDTFKPGKVAVLVLDPNRDSGLNAHVAANWWERLLIPIEIRQNLLQVLVGMNFLLRVQVGLRFKAHVLFLPQKFVQCWLLLLFWLFHGSWYALDARRFLVLHFLLHRVSASGSSAFLPPH